MGWLIVPAGIIFCLVMVYWPQIVEWWDNPHF